METNTSVPSNFGRYMAIAEYLLLDKDFNRHRLDRAMIQPRFFFVDTIKKIHAGKQHQDIDILLSSIIDSFPADGLPSQFSLSEQSIIMINYNNQKSKLYETDTEEDKR